jgi:hypothetical protein
MSQLAPFIRGYRNAMRDVKTEVFNASQTFNAQAVNIAKTNPAAKDETAGSVVMALTTLSSALDYPLHDLKDPKSKLRIELGYRQYERGPTRWPSGLTHKALDNLRYQIGYQQGFRDAIDTLIKDTLTFNYPPARAAIFRVLAELEDKRGDQEVELVEITADPFGGVE